MPPLIIAAIGTLGAAALVKFLVRESRRVNEVLNPHRHPAGPDDPGERLEKDPDTGAYRPRRRS